MYEHRIPLIATTCEAADAILRTVRQDDGVRAQLRRTAPTVIFISRVQDISGSYCYTLVLERHSAKRCPDLIDAVNTVLTPQSSKTLQPA